MKRSTFGINNRFHTAGNVKEKRYLEHTNMKRNEVSITRVGSEDELPPGPQPCFFMLFSST